MKFYKILFLLFITFLSISGWAQDQEVLLEKKLVFTTDQLPQVLDKTEGDIKVFAEHFTIRLDNDSKLVSEQVVSGSLLEPVLNVSVEKCVFIFCQIIDLDAAFTLIKLEPSKKCDHNYQLVVDFARSSEMLSDLYSSINSNICMKKTKTGANVSLRIVLVHAPTYSSGLVQEKAFELISLQPQAIFDSFVTVMILNGVADIKVLN